MIRTPQRSSMGFVRAILLVGILLCTISFVLFQIYGQPLSIDGFREAILDFGAAGPLVSVILMVLHGLFPVPVEFLSAANGVIFGFWGGVALTWLGMMLASWAGYGIARFTSGSALKFIPYARVERVRSWIGRGGWWKLLLARQLPFVSFWAMNLALGVLKVSFLRFTWTTAIGNVPYVIGIVLLSSSVS